MPRKQKKYHYIYKTICVVTKRYYIGMHSTDNLDDGYMGSGKRLWYSLKKHGHDKHDIEILEHYNDRKSLKKREEELVNEDLLIDPMCMNLKLGGHGGNIGPNGEVYGGDKFKAAHKYWNDPKNKKRMKDLASKIIKENHKNGVYKYGYQFKGRKHSEETKEKLRSVDRTGSKNSQFGTCWIYNDFESKKVKRENLDSYLNNGWIKGRKMGN